MRDSDLLEGLLCYFPGVLAILLTVGVSLADHLPVVRPGLPTTIALAVPPAALLASVIVWSDREPSGARVLALAVLSWGVFSLARIPLVDPAAARIVGSPLALLDLVLVWAGSYAVAGAVVYCIDWPAVETPTDDESDRSQHDVADD